MPFNKQLSEGTRSYEAGLQQFGQDECRRTVVPGGVGNVPKIRTAQSRDSASVRPADPVGTAYFLFTR